MNTAKNDDGQPIDPREQKLRDFTLAVTKKIDADLAGIGFAIFIFDFGPSGFASYASNADRGDMRRALIEHLIRTETYEERLARTGAKK